MKLGDFLRTLAIWTENPLTKTEMEERSMQKQLWDDEDKKREERVEKLKTVGKFFLRWTTAFFMGSIVAFGLMMVVSWQRQKQFDAAMEKYQLTRPIPAPRMKEGAAPDSDAPIIVDSSEEQVACQICFLEYDSEAGEMTAWLEEDPDGKCLVNRGDLGSTMLYGADNKCLVSVKLPGHEGSAWWWLYHPVLDAIQELLDKDDFNLQAALKEIDPDDVANTTMWTILTSSDKWPDEEELHWQDENGHYWYDVGYLRIAIAYFQYAGVLS